VPAETPPKSIPLKKIYRLWFDSDLFRVLLQRINKSFVESKRVSSSEFFAWMKVELVIAAYGTHPDNYFDPNYAELYPTASKGMQYTRYNEILNALKKSERDLAPDTGVPIWRGVQSLDMDIVNLEASMRETARNIAFVPNITIVCLDDHHEQLRNRQAVRDTGFAWINNPAKRVGSVLHSMASACTGIHFGGDSQRISDSGKADASTKRLLTSLAGRDLCAETHVLHYSNRVDVDRGYSEGTIVLITKHGLKVHILYLS
jgi:hypothetical protein